MGSPRRCSCGSRIRRRSACASGARDAITELGLPGASPEGRFFPDTYAYSRGVSDLTVLKRAAETLQRKLDAVWAERAPNLPLRTADEALTVVQKARDIQNAGAAFLEVEVVPVQLADHITRLGGLPCAEARDGQMLAPGQALLAPGDRHLLVEAQFAHIYHGIKRRYHCILRAVNPVIGACQQKAQRSAAYQHRKCRTLCIIQWAVLLVMLQQKS